MSSSSSSSSSQSSQGYVQTYNKNLEDSSSSPVHHITIVVLDFDGTLTRTPGGEVVFTDFYKGLLDPTYKNKNNMDDYTTPMYSIEEVENKIKTLTKPTDPYRISADAEAFLERLLCTFSLKQNYLKILILSKNQKTYIEAMLRCCHSSVIRQFYTHMDIIDIVDGYFAKDGSFKDESLRQYLFRQTYQKQIIVDHLHIFDDDVKGADILFKEAKSKRHSIQFVMSHCHPPYQFNWPSLAQEVVRDIELSAFRNTLESQRYKAVDDHMDLLNKLHVLKQDTLSRLIVTPCHPNTKIHFHAAETEVKQVLHSLDQMSQQLNELVHQLTYIQQMIPPSPSSFSSDLLAHSDSIPSISNLSHLVLERDSSTSTNSKSESSPIPSPDIESQNEGQEHEKSTFKKRKGKRM